VLWAPAIAARRERPRIASAAGRDRRGPAEARRVGPGCDHATLGAVSHELVTALETQPIDAFAGLLRRRLGELGVCLVGGRVIARAEADALVTEALAVARRALGELVDRPGDALRVLDAARSAGFDQLEADRPRLEAERARRFPPPAPATWRELAELRALAAADPALCRVGPPATHVEFAARLAAAGHELPGELLAFYAAAGDVELTCRHVGARAGGICSGEALRVRDGRLIVLDRVRRHPANLHVEQPGVSLAQAIGTWWLVLEDDRAPATRRPLDLQGLLRFALRRVEAPSLEVLLTDLAWRRFFA